MGTVWFNGCRRVGVLLWTEESFTEEVAASGAGPSTSETFPVHQADAAAGRAATRSIEQQEEAESASPLSMAEAYFYYHLH